MTLEPLIGNVEHFIHAHGPVAVGAVIFFESFGAPLPGESILILSGVLAAKGEVSLPAILIFAGLGAICGDSVGYWIGRTFGRAVLVRHGSRFGLTQERFQKVEDVFARWGPAAVAFARFVNVLRQLNGLVAGTAGMAWPRFLMFNVIGALLWVLTWGLGAYYFSDHVSSLSALMRHLGAGGIAAIVVAAVIVVALVLVLARRTGGASGKPT
jgi:membrane protein DedA with SNARE-associated domain